MPAPGCECEKSKEYVFTSIKTEIVSVSYGSE